jgi:hypothetical protein
VANDASVRSAINGMLEGRFKPPPRTVGKGQWVSSVTLTEGAFNVIKIQFIALGFVTVGKEMQENRKLGGILWRLTELGQTRMVQTLAVRTGKTEGSALQNSRAIGAAKD